jgi:general secretion pathway protein E
MVDELSRREARRLVDEAGILHPLIQALLEGTERSGSDLAEDLLGRLARLCDADLVASFQVRTGDNTAHLVHRFGLDPRSVEHVLPFGRGILGHSLAAAETIATDQMTHDGRFDRDVDVLVEEGISALASVPIRYGGSVGGCLVAQRRRVGRDGAAFSDVQTAVLEDAAPFVGFAARYLGVDSERVDEATRRLCRARLGGMPDIDDAALLEADADLVRSFERPLLTHCRLLPIARTADGLRVAVVSPNDLVTLEDFRLATGEEVSEVLLASSAGLRGAMRHYFEGDTPPQEAPPPVSPPQVDKPPAAAVSESDDEAIERLAYTVLQEAVRPGVLELHVIPGPVGARLLARTDAGLEERWRYPLRQHLALAQRVDHLAHDGGGTLILSKGTRGVIRSTATHHGPALVIQVRSDWGTVTSLERTGLRADGVAELRRWYAQTGRLVLLAGRRRTGRFAAALSILGEARAGGSNCVVAHHRGPAGIGGVVDVTLPESLAADDAGRAWARTLGIGPDILVTGDLRDAVATAAAAEAAASGALVVATIHAATVQSAIDRLLGLGLARAALDRLLVGVALFVTAPRLCPDCRVETGVPGDGPVAPGLTTGWRAPGCETCAGRGWLGRVRLHQLAAWPGAASDSSHLARYQEDVISLANEGDIAPEVALGLLE